MIFYMIWWKGDPSVPAGYCLDGDDDLLEYIKHWRALAEYKDWDGSNPGYYNLHEINIEEVK